MLQVAEASQRAVKAGVAVQLPIDGLEGTQVTVWPNGEYVIDTSTGKQVYDVTADGLIGLKLDLMDADSVGERRQTLIPHASPSCANGIIPPRRWQSDGGQGRQDHPSTRSQPPAPGKRSPPAARPQAASTRPRA